MKYILSFLLFLFYATSISAQENRWELMFEWGENNKYTSYYDTETINYTDDYVEVWVMTYFNETIFTDEKQTDFYMEKIHYYCNSATVKTLEFIVYYVDGSSTKVPPESTEESAIIPDSNGESFWQYFCQGKRF